MSFTASVKLLLLHLILLYLPIGFSFLTENYSHSVPVVLLYYNLNDSSNTNSVIEDIGRHVSVTDEEPVDSTYLLQCISVVIQHFRQRVEAIPTILAVI